MRKFLQSLLGVFLLASGISAAAHGPTHIINSSGKPWVLAATEVQGTVKVATSFLLLAGKNEHGAIPELTI